MHHMHNKRLDTREHGCRQRHMRGKGEKSQNERMEEVDHCGMLYGRLIEAFEEAMTNDHQIFNFTFYDDLLSGPDINDAKHSKTIEQLLYTTNSKE